MSWASAKVVGVDITRRRRIIIVQFAPSNAGNGGYVTGGDPFDLTTITNPFSLPMAFFSVYIPQVQDVNFLDTLAGNDGEWIAGTTLNNGKVKLYGSGSTEHANGAYTGAELADTIQVAFSIPIGK